MKLFRIIFFVSFLILGFSLDSQATHIVGGSLSYEHLGGSSYKVTLRLYRDCDPNSFIGENTAWIEIRRGNGTDPGLSQYLPKLDQVVLDPPLDSCAIDPGICVEEQFYSAIISLPPSATGYHMFHQTYARNNSIINIVSPGDYGEGFYTYVPNVNLLLTNSSPVWTNFPPVFVCQGQNVDFDHSAVDPNGDSLVYSLYRPFDGRRFNIDVTYNTFLPTINALGTPPNNITFPTVVYEPGFGVNNPLNVSGTPLNIDPVTGYMSGIPENIGQYVVGVRCEEYRDGVKIGEIVRDFQFNVVVCPPLKEAGIGPITNCDGINVQMNNASSAGAEDFFWNFGDASPGIFGIEPVHTFPGVGDYLITLIAQYGTICADTATYLYRVGGVTGDIIFVDSICVNNIVNFTESSTVQGSMVVNSWNWSFGDGTPNSAVPNPSHPYNMSGDLTVTLIIGTDAGCYDTITELLYVQGLPNANVGPDTTACFNNPNISLNGIVSNAQGGVWVGNGGVFNPNTTDLNANYDPSEAEIAAGFTWVILSSTGNGFCPSNQDSLRIDFIDGPTVNAGSDIEVCSDTSSVPISATFQFAGGVEWFTINGTGTFTNALSSSTTYIPSAGDLVIDSVVLYVQTIINGNCFGQTDSLTIFFFDPPTISIVYPDTICANNPIFLNSNATTGSGVWSTAGDGAFVQDSSVATSYIHGPNDLTNGSVQIYYETTNNGGCQIQRDTINIGVIPSPEVDFTFSMECFGTATEFNSEVVSSEPIVGYSWTLDGNVFSTNENPSYAIPVVDVNDITLIVTSQNGCSDTITLPVSTYYLPLAAFQTPAPCLNGETQFFDASTVNGGEVSLWEWSFGDGAGSTVEDPLHQYGAAGIYNVSLIVTSDQGCVDTVSNSTEIYPGPNAAFSNEPEFANVFQNVNFTDLSTSTFPIVSWLWDFADGNTSSDQNTSYNFSEGGDYNVILIVEDDNGCVDTANNVVYIYLPPLVPSGFSPNGDNSNDFLFVYGGPFETVEFKIYNNWGEVIFESTDAAIGWDGKYKDVDQPIGVFVWTVKATTTDGALHEISGDTSLIR